MCFAAQYGRPSPTYARTCESTRSYSDGCLQPHSNIIERRYHLEEADASTKASYLLAGSVVLYPIVSKSIGVVTTTYQPCMIDWLHCGRIEEAWHSPTALHNLIFAHPFQLLLARSPALSHGDTNPGHRFVCCWTRLLPS